MLEPQPGSELCFDQFCEQLCEGCRVVRWLGKADSPEPNHWGKYREIPKGSEGYKFQLSGECFLCQQFLDFLPDGTVNKPISIVLSSLNDEETTFYDMLELSICNGPRKSESLMVFGVLDPESNSEVTITSLSAASGTDSTAPKLVVSTLQTDKINYEKIRCWLDACAKHHENSCISTQAHVVPHFRLIDCVDGTIVTPGEARFEYVALSYVWGAADCSHADSSSFPDTIIDGMAVTKALGLRYLWVDRYVSDTSLRKDLEGPFS